MDNHRKGADAVPDFQIRSLFAFLCRCEGTEAMRRVPYPGYLQLLARQRRLRRNYGVSQELLSASDVVQLEPRLTGFEVGLFFPKAINLSDPGEVMRLLSSAVRYGIRPGTGGNGNRATGY